MKLYRLPVNATTILVGIVISFFLALLADNPMTRFYQLVYFFFAIIALREMQILMLLIRARETEPKKVPKQAMHLVEARIFLIIWIMSVSFVISTYRYFGIERTTLATWLNRYDDTYLFTSIIYLAGIMPTIVVSRMQPIRTVMANNYSLLTPLKKALSLEKIANADSLEL